VKRALLIVGSACLLGLFVLGVFTVISWVTRLFHPYLDLQIKGPTTLSNEWQEIVPEKPLRPERVVQEVVIYVEKPVTQDRDSFDLVMPDGSRVTPEVQLIDDHENVYDLLVPSAFTYPNSTEAFQRGFGKRDLPRDRIYHRIRIRSATPVRVLKIVWRCYDPRDIM